MSLLTRLVWILTLGQAIGGGMATYGGVDMSPGTAATAADSRLARRTPVVEVFEAAKDTVVNISSTQIVEVRSPQGFDRLFEGLFDFPVRRRSGVRRYKQTSVGSGFVLHPAGYIVTNAHVVARTAEREVIFADQRRFAARIIAIDHERDLAVLKIAAPKPYKPIPLGRSDDLMVGETVIAIGNPLGYKHTVTAGVVSALDRTLEVRQDLKFEGLIQTDASINPGNSGGALLNILGQLVGINTAIRGDAQNIGFAIPVDQLRAVLPELLDVERRYRFQVGLAVSHNTPCTIERIAPGSPAERAGVRVGDVIVELDSQPVRSGIDYHINLIDRRPGQLIQMTLLRDGNKIGTSITPEHRPKPDGAQLLVLRFGLSAEPLTDRMARALGLNSTSGMLISAVEPGSPAADTKFRRGDILIGIGRYQPDSLDEVGDLLEQTQPGSNVRLTILRVSGRVIYRLSAQLRAR